MCWWVTSAQERAVRIQTAAYKDLVGAALVILAACGSSGGSGDKDAEEVRRLLET